jgi:DNA-binding response OmpR family regulator
VLVVMPEHWPRALLRSALREAGYDAVGTRGLVPALRIGAHEPNRGPVRLVVVDQGAMSEESDEALALLRTQHDDPAMMLLARATSSEPGGEARWQHVVRRPLSVADIVAAVQRVLPLPATMRHAID